MTKNQPFLSGFPTQICGSIRRRLEDVIAAKRRELADSSIATYAMQFSHILPADFLHGLSVFQRIRQYCNVVVFWTWLARRIPGPFSAGSRCLILFLPPIC